MCHRETPKHQSGTRGGQQETTSIPSYTTMTGHEKPAFRQSISPLKPKKKVMGNAGTVFLLQVATQVSFLMDSVDPVLFCRDGELCEEHTYQSDTDNSYLTISDTDNSYLTVSIILITAISLSLILITAISLSLILITASLTISDTAFSV